MQQLERRRRSLEDRGVEGLFLELASESRLGILRELQTRNLRTQEIASRLDMTATEAVRQLQRLSEASLVQRQPEGSYAITEYGKLMLQLSSSSEFVFNHREYFLDHDVFRLPYQFVNRIGELSQTNLIMDAIENMNKVGQMFRGAEEFLWAMGEQAPESVGQTLDEQVQKGVKFRFLVPESLLPAVSASRAPMQNIDVKGLPDLPALIGINEKEAIVGLRFVGGRVDYASFYGRDPISLNWVRDLFLYYWDKGKR